ncbi:MAG: hypothetical protein ACSHXK_04275 [Oceanococcus sp.]
MRWIRLIACCGLALFANAAQAHSFGKLYTLPVPLWMYTWGASAALILSFVMVAWFVNQPNDQRVHRQYDLSQQRWAKCLLSWPAIAALKAISLCGLLLCIATGLFGTGNAYLNFNMTFFWIVFVLGFGYFTALFGGLYNAINPWKTMVSLSAYLLPTHFQGRFNYPICLGCWPAFGLYLTFIWIELFGEGEPYSLSLLLIAYSAFNLAGAWLIGSRHWFEHAEFFSVLFRLISKMAPLQYLPPHQSAAHGKLILQMPFVGLLQSRAVSFSELLFLLFILSSTAFDGLHQTDVWVRFYWQDIAGTLAPWTGENIVQAYPLLRSLYLAFQSAVLLLSPLLYLGFYLACLWILQGITRSTFSLQQLALHFAYSLLPIALVYHVTHYYTLILSQGAMIFRLVSDPFGWGWNLFGTAQMMPKTLMPDMDWVWHTQVCLILLGHIVSVYLAHKQALRLFPNRREALLSQLPMLVLMVAFTCFGLWILAQPITSTVIPQ